MIFGPKNEISNFEASLWWVFFPKYWEPVINISWLKNEQVKVCFFTFESPHTYFCCNLRHVVMPYMYSEMQNKLPKSKESPLASMGQIISTGCPERLFLDIFNVQQPSPWRDINRTKRRPILTFVYSQRRWTMLFTWSNVFIGNDCSIRVH